MTFRRNMIVAVFAIVISFGAQAGCEDGKHTSRTPAKEKDQVVQVQDENVKESTHSQKDFLRDLTSRLSVRKDI